MDARRLQRQTRCAIRGCLKTRAKGSPFCPRHLDLLGPALGRIREVEPGLRPEKEDASDGD